MIASSSGLLASSRGRWVVLALLTAASMLAPALGLGLFAQGPVSGSYWFDVLPASLIVAFGLPAAFVGVAIPAVKAVNEADRGLASGLVNTVQRIGSGLGVAVLTSLAMARTGSLQAPSEVASLADGFQVAFLGASLFAALGAVVAMIVIQGPKGVARDDASHGRTLERGGSSLQARPTRRAAGDPGRALARHHERGPTGLARAERSFQ